MIFLILLLAVFFAVNMGGASFAASFAAAYGGKVITGKKASFLFIIFVVLGAVFFGSNVAVTLGNDIIPASLMDKQALAIIFLCAGGSMYVANVAKIPQSTSLVTVAAIAGVGAAFSDVNVKTILYLLPFWLVLPVLSYFITLGIAKIFYPARGDNFWVYEKFINQRSKLKKFVILCSCYNAFSVGTNNVANVAGPIVGTANLTMEQGLLIFAFFYGLGAFVFQEPIKTAGDKIVPLGLMSASLVALVSGTLMIGASLLGIPQSFVMIKMGAVFAISSLKQGTDETLNNPITKQTFYTWSINPVITFFITFIAAWILIK